jgi:hypothetical protein
MFDWSDGEGMKSRIEHGIPSRVQFPSFRSMFMLNLNTMDNSPDWCQHIQRIASPFPTPHNSVLNRSNSGWLFLGRIQA